MNQKLRQFLVKLLALSLAIIMSFPINVFAKSLNKSKSGYETETNFSNIAENDEILEKNPTLETSKVSISETPDYILEKSAVFSKTSGTLTYKIIARSKSSINSEKSRQTATFAINANTDQKDLKVEKVTTLNEDGSEREIEYEENRPKLSENTDGLDTLAVSTNSNEDEIVYYLNTNITDKSKKNLESSSKLFSIDYSIVKDDQEVNQDRYTLEATKDLLEEKENEDVITKGEYKKKASTDSLKDTDQIIWNEYIASKSGLEQVIDLNIDNNQDFKDSQIKIVYYKAKDNGYIMDENLEEVINYVPSISLQIPQGYIAKLELITKANPKAKEYNLGQAKIFKNNVDQTSTNDIITNRKKKNFSSDSKKENNKNKSTFNKKDEGSFKKLIGASKTTNVLAAMNSENGPIREYPYALEYLSHQYYDLNKDTINWDIKVDTSKLLNEDLKFDNIGLALYAPENQKLENYKVRVRDYLGKDISDTASELFKDVANSGNSIEEDGTLKDFDDFKTYNKQIKKEELSDNLIIHVEAKPTDNKKDARFSQYDLGLRITPDSNYIKEIVNQFQNDWKKLEAMIPWIVPFKNGEDAAAKFVNGFNLIDARLSADTPQLEDENYETKAYTDKSRSIYGQLLSDKQVKWQVSETLKLEDKKRFVKEGNLGDDVLSASFANDDKSNLNSSIEVLEPKTDGTYEKYFETDANNPADFKKALQSKLSNDSRDFLKPGTIINYIFTNDVGDSKKDSSVAINFSKTNDNKDKNSEKALATIRPLNDSEKVNRYHIGRQLAVSQNQGNGSDTWRYESMSNFRVKENYDMVFCINPGATQPSRSKFWNNSTNFYIEKKDIKTSADLDPYLQRKSSSDVRDADKILDDIKKVYYYGEIKRNTEDYFKSTDYSDVSYQHTYSDEKYSEMIQYALARVAADKEQAEHFVELMGASGASIKKGEELYKQINNLPDGEWTDEKRDAVDLKVYANSKSMGSNGSVGNSDKQFQNMINGKVYLPISVEKKDEKGNILPGAKFALKKDGKQLKTWTSTDKAEELFLDQGTYQIEEVQTPPTGNYKKLSPITISVEDKTETRNQEDIPLQKDDSTGNGMPARLKDSEYDKKYQDLNFYGGKQKVLIQGNKKSIEDYKNIAGANYSQKYRKITVSSNDTNKDKSGKDLVKYDSKNLKLEAVNVGESAKPSTGKFKIKKVNENGDPLENVGFSLYQSDRKTIIRSKDSKDEEYFTNDKGYLYFSNLDPGTYYLKETKALSGYKIKDNNPWTKIVVSSDGKVTLSPLDLKENEDKKPEEVDPTEVNKPLNPDSKDSENPKEAVDSNIIISKTTPNDSKAYLEYKIVNIHEEEKDKAKIVVHKKDDEGKALEGVEFTLYDENKKEIDSKQTDKNGEIEFAELDYGKYFLKETKAIDGYILNEEFKAITIEKENNDQENSANPKDTSDSNNSLVYNVDIVNKKNKVEFTKIGIDDKTDNNKENNNYLKGAQFELKNKKGDVIGERQTSDDKGKFGWEKIPQGEYEVWETKALDGYVKPNKPVATFRVDENGRIKEISNETIKNSKAIYPSTGGSGTFIGYAIIGTSVMLAGISYYAIYINNKKRYR